MIEHGEGTPELPGLGQPEWWEPLLEKVKQGTQLGVAIDEVGQSRHFVDWWRGRDPDMEAQWQAAAEAGRWFDVSSALPEIERLVKMGTSITKAADSQGISKNRLAVYLRNHPHIRKRLNLLKVGKGISDHRLLVGWLKIALVEETREVEDAFALIYLRALREITEAVDVTGAEVTVAEVRDRVLSAVAGCMAHREDMPQMLREELGLEDDEE